MKRKPKNKRQHFVPRHYLRHFSTGRDRIGVAALDPFRYIGVDVIKTHCQANHFYGKVDQIDDWLGSVERLSAPMLRRIATDMTMEGEELVAMRLLAVIFHMRTRKAAEIAKLWPKRVADMVLKNAIDRGELPPPPGGWRPGLMDFQGANSALIRQCLVGCFLEMDTLEHRFLCPDVGVDERFVTSDHPVVLLNPFLDRGADSTRCFAGFSRAGFQLVFPLSPKCCLVFFDPGVYEFASTETVRIGSADVDRINSLQFQSADKCLVFDPGTTKEEIERLRRFADYRRPVGDHLRPEIFSEGIEGLQILTTNVLLPEELDCCRLLECPRVGENAYRDPIWSEFCTRVEGECDGNFEEIEEAMRRVERKF